MTFYEYILAIRGQIGCMCVLIYIAGTYFSTKRKNTTNHKLFSALIITSILNLIFDMTTVYTVNHLDTTPLSLNKFFHMIFIASFSAVLFIIYMYVRNLVDRDAKTRGWFFIPMGASVLGVFFLPVDFVVSRYGNYSSGMFLTVAFGCAYLYFFLIIYILVTNWKKIEKKARNAVVISMVTIFASTIIQLMLKEFLASHIGLTIINVALFYTVESPDAMLIELLDAEKERAESANKAKSFFLAQMSHEIRTPINAVLGMNEMILREATDEEILEYSANIKESGRTLLFLINSILDFSKIEDGKMEIIETEYETKNVITNVINAVYERATAKNLELITDIDKSIPTALIGDDVRLNQIIMNLLTNAVKYTEKGQVILSVKMIQEDEENVWLKILVKDTGIGIKEEDRERLFETFERLDQVRNRSIEGTGLGMSIVTGLLSMMGSKLEVNSVYGLGSEFYFVIKQKISDKTPIGDFSSSRKVNGENLYEKTVFKAPNARILVVDDNNMNLKVAKNLFKIFDITPHIATSGYEAIDMVSKNKYDIIFLDHMMPDMDGIETIKKMKTDNLVKDDVCIVAMTANAVVGAKDIYIEAGFDDYLSKPVEIKRLEKILDKYLKEKDDVSVVEDVGGSGESSDADRDEDNRQDILKNLEKHGINTKSGLDYCMEDTDIYMEMIEEYIRSSKQYSKLDEYYEKEDWDNYKILVHSLKSNSKTIGAEMVSQRAQKLEAAAGEKDKKTIQSAHPELMKIYEETLEVLRKY